MTVQELVEGFAREFGPGMELHAKLADDAPIHLFDVVAVFAGQPLLRRSFAVTRAEWEADGPELFRRRALESVAVLQPLGERKVQDDAAARVAAKAARVARRKA